MISFSNLNSISYYLFFFLGRPSPISGFEFMFSQPPLAEHTLSHSHPSTNTRSYGHPCRKKKFYSTIPRTHMLKANHRRTHTLKDTPAGKKNLQHHSPNTRAAVRDHSPNTRSYRHPCRKKNFYSIIPRTHADLTATPRRTHALKDTPPGTHFLTASFPEHTRR